MAKDAKKKAKLETRLKQLETELLTAVTKKDSKSAEVNVPEYTRKIKELKAQIASM